MGKKPQPKNTQEKKLNALKDPKVLGLIIPWACAFVLLFMYYAFIQFPMERSFVKGLKAIERNDMAEASTEFQKVLKVYPTYEPVYLNISKYYAKHKRFQDSNFFYNKARRICLINSEIFSERGLIYAQYTQKKLEKGVDFYNNHVEKYYLSSLFYPNEKK